MSEAMNPANGLRFGCPGCGSGLKYDIGLGKMHCGNCGSSYALEEIADPSRNAEDGMMDAAEYRCPQCGAAVHTSQTAATSFCSYCGADVILTQRLTRTRRPDSIVPFAVTREKCEEIYRKRVREARYAPADFGADETISHFRPVYIPYWQYGGSGAGAEKGIGSKSRSDAKYDYTDKYEVNVSGSVTVSGMLYDASVSFEDETAQQLRFSDRQTRPFHPAYLCGFYAEAPDTKPDLYRDQLLQFARKVWKGEYRKRSGLEGAEVGFFEKDFASDVKLVLLPVWLLAHRSGKRVVYTAVNGDTGTIVCDTPIGNRRFARLAVEMTVLAAAVLTLLSFLLILRPRLLASLCGLTAAMAQWVIAGVSKDLAIRSARADDLTWMTMHAKSKKAVKVKKRSRTPGYGWYIPLSGTALIVGLGIIGTYMEAYDFNQFVGSLISEHAWLPPVVLLCAAVFFLFSCYKRQNWVDDGLFVLRLAAVAVTLLATLFAADDMIYYACAFLTLGLTAISLARLNKAHNRFVSRPVPFFGKEGTQA